MEERRKKIKLKVKENKKTGIENYISIALKVIGLLFMGFSIYYFIDAQGQDFLSVIYSYFTSSNDSKIVYNTNGEFPIEIVIFLLIGYIPAICGVLAILHFSHKNLRSYYKFLVPIIIIMALYNTLTCFYWIFYCGFFYYYNYFIAGSILTVSLFLFFTGYINYKKRSLLISIIFFFHAFMLGILLQTDNENRYLFIFIPISIFSVILYYINKGGKNSLVSLLNVLFSYLFLILFIIKRIVFNTNSSDLIVFITFSIVFYLIFYGITFKIYIEEKRKIFASLNIANTVVFIALNTLVFLQFDALNYLFIVVFVAIATHLLSLYLSYKNINFKTDFKRLEITTLLLISSFVSLIFYDYLISVFFGLFSLLLFLYAQNNKIKSPMPFVAVMLLIVFANVIYVVFNAYLTMVYSTSIGFNYVLQNSFITIAIALIIIAFLRKRIQDSNEKEEGKNWFNRKKYAIYLDSFFSLMILLTVQWAVFTILFSKNYVAVFSNRVALLIAAIFLFFIIKLASSISHKIKKWICFSICLYSIFIISLIYFQISFENCFYITANNLFLTEIILHYVELLSAIYLFYISFSKLETLSGKSYYKMMKYIIILISFLITVICCFEFDYISIWAAQLNIEKFDIEKYEIIVESNKLLPYSIIILICISMLLILGLKMKNKIIKITSSVVFGLTITKIILMDFTMISDSAKSFAFIVIGGLLLLISWYYNSNNEKSKKRISSNN